MRGRRGQSTVEWTGLLLLVAVAFGGMAMAAHAVGDAGLPERLACAIAGRDCAARRGFAPAGFLPPGGLRAALGTRRSSNGLLDTVGSVSSALGTVAIVVPTASIVGG